MDKEADNLFKKAVSEQPVPSKIFGQQDNFSSVSSTSQFSSQPTNNVNIFGQPTQFSIFGQVSNLNPTANPICFTDFDRESEKSKVSSAKDLFGNASRPSMSVDRNILKHSDGNLGHSSHIFGTSFSLLKNSDNIFGSKGETPSFKFSKSTDHSQSLKDVTETPELSCITSSETSRVLTGLTFTNPSFRTSNNFNQSDVHKFQSEKAGPTSIKVFGSKIDKFFQPFEKTVSSPVHGAQTNPDDVKPDSIFSAGIDNAASSLQFQANYQKTDLISEASTSSPLLQSHSQKLDVNPKIQTSIFGSDVKKTELTPKTSSLSPMIGSKAGDFSELESKSVGSSLHSSSKSSFDSATGNRSSGFLKNDLSFDVGKQIFKANEPSSCGGNEHSIETKNIPINIFSGSSVSKINAPSLFGKQESFKQTLFTSGPNPGSTEKVDVFRSSSASEGLEKDSNIVDEISIKQPGPENILDEDIFGLSNFEEPKAFLEKVSKPTSLIAVNVDEKYLNRSILKTHFSRFGAVNKILINKKSNQASIFFENHNSASEAKARGKRLHPKIPEMKLFYGAITDEIRKAPSTVPKREDAASKLIGKSHNEKLFANRPVISYGDIEKLPFDKPSAPIPKTKSSHKPVVKTAFTKQPVLIKSSILQKSSSFFKSESNKTTEVFKRRSTPPSKVFGGSVFTDKTKSCSSETKQVKSINTEEALKKNDLRSKAPSSSIASIKDNSILLKQQAHNNYDKYLILDARDKCLRLKQEKILDVNKAHYLLATCPDMCPEKERYSRDIQYDLSVYELTDGKLDHMLSVKKFSRSSADKDEPLPHELRLGPVLKITMDYLVCNIIDKEKQITQLDVWYNYLCNRTRALRNDIMTQHLIDDNAVYVLEKITRFHIHCSHHLCEEPADLFDSKMNAEHLTKSLQSLKELYLDMSEKNILYNSEAEFRAYEILLDAKDGNVIFKYLNFRDSVRNSHYVQFAVKVLNAIQSNNFVKFFKLLSQATYLQACIMHRHFLSIRLKALSVITKAYSLPKESQAIPVARVMSMLGFSNESNFESFIKHFGLLVEDLKININKNSFPVAFENLPPLKKSIDLVESKKRTTTGIVVQGGSLPQNPLEFYKPHDSFDGLGYLKPDAFDASDQRVKKSCTDHALQEENIKILLEPTSQVDKNIDHLNNEEIKRELIEKVKLIHKINLEKKFFGAWKQYCHQQKASKLSARRVLLKNIVNHWKKFVVAKSELNQRADKYIMAKYFGKLRKNNFVAKETRNIRLKVKSLTEKILMKQVVIKWKNMVRDNKHYSAIKFLRTRVITRKFFINWRLKTILSKLERRLDLYYKSKLLKIYLMKWKAWLVMKKGQRKVDNESFPACGSQLTLERQNELWSWGYNREKSVNLSVFQISNLDKEISEMSKKHILLQKLSGLISWSTLPLVQRFQTYIDSQLISNPSLNFHPPFRIVITIDPSIHSYFVEWIRTKFNFNEIDEFDGYLRSKITLSSHLDGSEYTMIVEENDHVADGIKASLRILICNKSNLSTFKRMASCQHDLSSLILCCSFDDDSSYDNDIWFLNKEAIDNPVTSEKLFYVVYECWKVYVKSTEVKKGSLQSLINSFITKKVIGPVFHAAGKVIQHGQPFLSPSIFVSFYNDGLTHVIRCLKRSRTLGGISLEDWNDEIFDNICGAIHSAFLPNFEVRNWPFCDDIMGYLSKYLKDVTDNSDWCGNLTTEIKKILNASSLKFILVDTEKDDQIHLRTLEITWLDVMSCCILYKISNIPSNLIVYYNLHVIENYETHQWINDLKESEVVNFKKIDMFKKNMHKRKGPLLPSNSQPKLKQKKVSQLLEELIKEKEAYLSFEKKYDDCNEIENELKLLQAKYQCKI